MTFNGINKSTQAIMSAKYEIKCSDENVKNYFNNFIETIGKVGEDITFDELLYSIKED
jgi:hypothetical protein